MNEFDPVRKSFTLNKQFDLVAGFLVAFVSGDCGLDYGVCFKVIRLFFSYATFIVYIYV